MKKIITLTLCGAILVACSHKNSDNVNPGDPGKSVKIVSGEFLGSVRLFTSSEESVECWDRGSNTVKYDEDILMQVLFEWNSELVNEMDHEEYSKNPRKASACERFHNPLGWLGRGEWYDSHIDCISNIDSERYLLGESLGRYPVPHSFTFYYLRIKSLKLYSLNYEVEGRAIGSDLSDLFECRYHPILFSYPDCKSFVEDYLLDPKTFQFSKFVELGVCPYSRINIYPLFELENWRQYKKIDYRIEITTEDDVRGEMTFTAELINPIIDPPGCVY